MYFHSEKQKKNRFLSAFFIFHLSSFIFSYYLCTALY